MKAIIVLLRSLSILFLLSFLSSPLAAQVVIRERVEIKPATRVMAKTSYGLDDLGCFEGSINPNSGWQIIRVRRPCKVIATGVYNCDCLYNGSITCAPSSGSAAINVTNATDSIPVVGCDGLNIYAPDGPTNAGGSILFNDVTVTFSGYVNCAYTATVKAHAIPLGRDPDSCRIGSGYEWLVANWEEYPYTVIGATPCDTAGTPFEHCVYLPVRFTIENPTEYVKLREYNGDETSDGNTVMGSFGPTAAYASFLWDPNSIRRDYVKEIWVLAEGLGVSARTKITLIKELPQYFDLTVQQEEIFRYQSVGLQATARTWSGEEETLGGDVPVVFVDLTEEGSFIVGSDTIPRQVTVPYDTARNGGVRYYACGTQEDVEIEIYRPTEYAGVGYAYVWVIPPCPVVSTKGEVAPGDTVAVDIMARRWDDTLVPYAENQEFEIWMNTDEAYGKLRSVTTGDEGTDIFGIQPFEFIAADSISEDSAVVELQVWPSGGGTGASISSPGNGALKIPVGISLKRQASPEATGTTQSLTKEEKIKRLLEKVKKSLAEMTNPTRAKQSSIIPADLKIPRQGKGRRFGRNQEIQEKLAGRLEQKLAMISEAKKSGASSQVKAKVTSKAAKFASVMQEAECEPPVATIVVKKKGPELEIDCPIEDQIIEGNTPPVWTRPIKARLKNFNEGEVKFYWDMKVEWSGNGNVHTPIGDYIYQGNMSGKNDEWVDLGIKIEGRLLGGNKNKLHVKAVGGEKMYETEPGWKDIFQIKGKNPPLATILSLLGDDKYVALAYQETRLNHFHSRTYAKKYDGESKEFPYQGVNDPDDIGIMQINKPKQDNIIWDWTVNIQTGKHFFDDAYDRAISYHLDYDDPSGTAKDWPFDEEERLCETYCEYNGGITRWYWDWEPGDAKNGIERKWKRSDDVVGNNEKQKRKCITAREYADDVDSLRINHPWR